MRKEGVSLVGLLQAMAIVTIVFSVTTALPVDHFAVQLFTHFKLQYLAASVSLLVVFLVLRHRVYALALLLVAALNASFVLPWYFGAHGVVGDEQITILHANILSTNTEHERLFALLDAEAPDVILLQEVTPQWLLALDRLRATYPHSYAEARDGNFGIALFSRLPLVSVSHVDSAPFAVPTIVASLASGERVLRLVASHPTIPFGKRMYDARNEQLDSIAALLRPSSGGTILVGDLNTSMWDRNYRALEATTGLRNVRRGSGVVPTWPTFMPFAMIPIDHVLVSGNISVVGVRSGPRIGSDHLPLIVTLSL